MKIRTAVNLWDEFPTNFNLASVPTKNNICRSCSPGNYNCFIISICCWWNYLRFFGDICMYMLHSGSYLGR